jgi:hypothetical protein
MSRVERLLRGLGIIVIISIRILCVGDVYEYNKTATTVKVENIQFVSCLLLRI